VNITLKGHVDSCADVWWTTDDSDPFHPNRRIWRVEGCSEMYEMSIWYPTGWVRVGTVDAESAESALITAHSFFF